MLDHVSGYKGSSSSEPGLAVDGYDAGSVFRDFEESLHNRIRGAASIREEQVVVVEAWVVGGVVRG